MLRACAWLGGVTFVASLAYGGWFYLVELAVPAAPGTPVAPAAAIDVALFTAFALHHSAMARSGAKAWIARHVSPAAERTLYVWVSSLLFLGVCLAWQPLPGTAYTAPAPVAWLLRGGQILGVWLTLRGASVVDPLELAGIRQAVRRERAVALRIVGPFRLVRHPIYLGWIFMVWCAPHMTMNRLLFAAVSTAYLALAIPFEERSLVAAHGNAYRAYQREVRWRLLPGLW
ncbi:MAG: isoprenylcysteine carboxylmethyltransferase family protein [Acidobacteriota bacterium]